MLGSIESGRGAWSCERNANEHYITVVVCVLVRRVWLRDGTMGYSPLVLMHASD